MQSPFHSKRALEIKLTLDIWISNLISVINESHQEIFLVFNTSERKIDEFEIRIPNF